MVFVALFNVRLDVEDQRKARALRNDGVRLSSLVREAIREEYRLRSRLRRAVQKPSTLVREVLASLPDPTRPAARGFELTDRDAVRSHIHEKIRRRR